MLAAAAAGAACYSPDELRDRADRDAFALIDARRERLFGDQGPFALPAATAAFGRDEATGELPTLRDEVLAGALDAIGPIDEVGAMGVAEQNSESVQRQKESLYTSALSLAEEEWRFGYRYNADGVAAVNGDAGGDLVAADAGFGASVTRVLGSGATILASLGADLFRFVSTGDGWDAISNAGVSITQPLLRGSGRLITLEPLRQTERDLVYAVRGYERFRRTFAVDVAGRVYRVQQSLDQQKNETENFRNLQSLSRRNKALYEAGQLSRVQSDQAIQEELRSQNQLVTLQGNVDRQLDLFKVFLGLPIQVDLTFEDGILARLVTENELRFLETLDGKDDEVVAFAIENRLDVMTAFDRVQDTVRREAILRDALRAGLGLSASANSSSDEGRPFGHRAEEAQLSARLELDLPVDLLPARNAWRRAELALVDERRSYERFLDQVTIDVRDALRRARNSAESLRIQLDAVDLSVDRARGAQLQLEAGRASTRDLLEAQEALRSVRDAATSARISFKLALYELQLQLEILRVDESGIFVDPDLEAQLLSLR